ncbi:MAG: 23S rRNA (guanosine(2251)-2'-O)-methyltransferase RlmB [Tunicatimonas sp.]|uniref:23S rRNA (guanosine(2251)-2'-O)-methyltransferase RlmB n=1 Tax=Tunicatimonas sp. TaxID=1940096 RepID=UPI003C722CA2
MSHLKTDIAFGTRAVQEALNSGREIERILLQKGEHNDLFKEVVAEARRQHIPISTVPIEKLNRVTRKNHQGIIAFLSSVVYASLDNIIDECYQRGQEPLLILMDRITDVRNFGAIARTAECLGVHAIVIPDKGNARLGGDAMKASAGALNHIPVCREGNLKQSISYLKSSGIRVVACTEKADDLLPQQDLLGPVALLLGSEEDGISEAYLKLADAAVKIPMSGQIASLNVSVAAAIGLYEVIRQRNS